MNWKLADLGTSPLPLISYVTLGAIANLSLFIHITIYSWVVFWLEDSYYNFQ